MCCSKSLVAWISRPEPRAAIGLFFLLLAVGPLSSAEEPAAKELANEKLPKPKPVDAPPRSSIEAAMEKGIKFLLLDQNKDGSWGSAEKTKELNIYAPVPGAHDAFRAAVTSLCISALCETGGDRQDIAAAIDRAEAWLVVNLPKVRRASGDAIYNVWTHAYGIEALVHLHARRKGDAAKQAEFKKLIAEQIDFMRRYESVNGGWGYYDFKHQTQQPASMNTSFTTATGLIALDHAKSIGVEIPSEMVKKALDSMRRQQKGDLSYLYGEYLKYKPLHPVNRPGGSLGRSQACNLALRIYGDPSITDTAITTWLDRLYARNLWLDIGRKRPIPHESWFAVAGYFFYYGHYYAALITERLPEKERPFYQDHLAHVLLPLQETDGSWWDYPLYNYHQQYGTAFALMSLKRCLK